MQHFQLKARLGQNEVTILVSKDMSVQEMLDAASMALQLSQFSHIVGFRDTISGLVVTPSILCSSPEQLNLEQTFEVLTRQQSQQPFARTGIESPQANVLSETQHSFNVRDMSQASHQPSSTQVDATGRAQNQAQILIQESRDAPMPEESKHSAGRAAINIEAEDIDGNGVPDITESLLNTIIQLVESWAVDAMLTEQIKAHIIRKIRNGDAGMLGAYRLFMADRDTQGFKIRLIHKCLGGHLGTAGTSGNAGLPVAEDAASSVTTAGFSRIQPAFRGWSAGPGQPMPGRSGAYGVSDRPSTHARFQRFIRPVTASDETANLLEAESMAHNMTQDRYLPTVITLENAGLLDEQTAQIIKTLIFEENLTVFRHLNNFLAKYITSEELAFNLSQVAQQALGILPSNTMQTANRPISPPLLLKNKKSQLQAYLKTLTRIAFRSKEEQEILQRLVQEENEHVLSCFDVFDSDKDQDSLIDSLQRIINKAKNENMKQLMMIGNQVQQAYGHSFGGAPEFAMMDPGLYEDLPRPQHSWANERMRSNDPYHSSGKQYYRRNMGGYIDPLQQVERSNNRRRRRGESHGIQESSYQTKVRAPLIPGYFDSSDQEANSPVQIASVGRGSAKRGGRNALHAMKQRAEAVMHQSLTRNYAPLYSSTLPHSVNNSHPKYYGGLPPRQDKFGLPKARQRPWNKRRSDMEMEGNSGMKLRGMRPSLGSRPQNVRKLFSDDALMDHNPSSQSQFVVDYEDYGDEMYQLPVHVGNSYSASHGSRYTGAPSTATFISDGRNPVYGGQKRRPRVPKPQAGEKNRRRNHSNQQRIESKPRKKYSSEEDAAMNQIPDAAYFYHQQQQHMSVLPDRFPADSEIPPVYDEFDPRGGIYVGLDGMGMEDEAEGQRPSGESEEDSDTLDSDSVLSSNESDSGSETSDKKQKKKRKNKSRRKKKQSRDKKKRKKDKKKKSLDLSSKQSAPAGVETGNASAANSNISLNYQNIIEHEQLYDQMNLDNYAILLHLIHQGEADIRQIFLNHSRHRDVMVLNIELNTRTEEALQSYLQKHLKVDEVKKLRKLRQAKSQEYLQIFRKFIPGMMGERQLMEQLRRLVKEGDMNQMLHDGMMGQKQFIPGGSSKTTELLVDQNSEQESGSTPDVIDRRERLGYLLQQYVQMRSNLSDVGARDQFLRGQLSAENPQLMHILESEASLTRALVQRLDEYVETASCRATVSDALQKFGVAQMQNVVPQVPQERHSPVEDFPNARRKEPEPPAPPNKKLYSSLRNAVADFVSKQILSQTQQEVIDAMMVYRDDRNLHAAWEVYQVMQDEADLADTLQVLCSVKQRTDPQNYSDEALKQPFQPPQNEADVIDQPVASAGDSREVVERSDDGALEEEESEVESGEDDATEDIEQIAQFQHKILRKYAMLGFIRYSAIPFFHQMVHIHDYKMSCIFEVFAKNRNDEDFLENLKILDEIRTRQEETQKQSEQPEEDPNLGEEEQPMPHGEIGQADAAIPAQEEEDDLWKRQVELGRQIQRAEEEEKANAAAQQHDGRGNAAPVQALAFQFGQVQPPVETNVSSADRMRSIDNQPQSRPPAEKADSSHAVGGEPSTEAAKAPKPAADRQPAAADAPTDPKRAALAAVKPELTPEEYEWFAGRVLSNGPIGKHASALKSYAVTKDLGDFANTVKIFYKKAHQ